MLLCCSLLFYAEVFFSRAIGLAAPALLGSLDHVLHNPSITSMRQVVLSLLMHVHAYLHRIQVASVVGVVQSSRANCTFRI
jgi:hypothetical protein